MAIDPATGQPMNNRPVRKARHVNNTARQMQAMDLRRAGASYLQIGQTMGITPKAASRLVKRAHAVWLTKLQESTREMVELELSRLDAMHVVLWHEFQKGSGDYRLRVADRLLRVAERRAALKGLDAPKDSTVEIPREGYKVEVEVVGTASTAIVPVSPTP